MSDDERAGALDQLVRSVLVNVRAQIAVLGAGTRLALAELKLVASRAALALGAVIVLAGMVLVGWTVLLILGAFILHAQGLSAVQAVMIVFVLHLGGIGALVFLLWRTVGSMSFEHTRHALQGGALSPAEASGEAAQSESV